MSDRITIKLVVWDADFRKTGQTQWDELPRGDRAQCANKGDAVCFVSASMRLVRFVAKPIEIVDRRGEKWPVVCSRDVRMGGYRTFSALMIANYVEEAGWSAVGLKKLEENERFGSLKETE